MLEVSYEAGILTVYCPRTQTWAEMAASPSGCLLEFTKEIDRNYNWSSMAAATSVWADHALCKGRIYFIRSGFGPKYMSIHNDPARWVLISDSLFRKLHPVDKLEITEICLKTGNYVIYSNGRNYGVITPDGFKSIELDYELRF